MPDLDIVGKFKMQMCDGKCAAQVHIFNQGDLIYWLAEANRTNHKMIFSYHINNNPYQMAHDVYQVVPLEFSHA